MEESRKKKIVSIVALMLLLFMIIGASVAYFVGQIGTGATADINASTGTTDSLMFKVGDPINILANMSNFKEGDGNVNSTTYANAILIANNGTNEASYNYNLYLDIIYNDLVYTTSDKKPELLLKIASKDNSEDTTEEATEITSGITGLEYKTITTTSGTYSGFDITEKKGIVEIALNHEISTMSRKTNNWEIEVIFVNLDSDQQLNTGKSLNAKLVIRQEEHAGSKVLKNVTNSTTTEIWGHKDTITKIVFEDTPQKHENAELVYDLSSAKDESIMAYMINNGDDTYTTYINCLGKITAHGDSSYLFYQFVKLESIEGLENLDTSQVKNMSCIFRGSSNLIALDLSSWDVSKVTSLTFAFAECDSLTSINLSNWDTSSLTNISYMFYLSKNLSDIDVSNFNTSKVTSMQSVFSSCGELTSLDLSKWDTSKVTNMSSMFSDCNNLTILNVSDFDTTNVKLMHNMFSGCNKLVVLDLSKWNTINVTSSYNMFNQCHSLTTLDVSSFNMSLVTDMYGMFAGCSSLTTLDLRNLDMSKVTRTSSMFSSCKNLINLDLRSASIDNVSDTSYMFSSVPANIQIKVKDESVQSFMQNALGAGKGTITIV